MCSQKVSCAAHPAGMATGWGRGSGVGVPWPSSHALYEPPCAASLLELVMVPLLADHDEAPDSKPGLASSWREVQPPGGGVVGGVVGGAVVPAPEPDSHAVALSASAA